MITLTARGHPNITATHKTTLAFTKDSDITPRGDCFLGCKLSYDEDKLRKFCRQNKKITMVIKCGNQSDKLTGSGSVKFTIKKEMDIVARKTSFVNNRTIMINCNKAAKDVSRTLVKELQKPESRISITLF